MKDSDIVIDKDAPAWTPDMFVRAIVRKGLEPVPKKSLLSLRIDADVLEWFRSQGRGYQSVAHERTAPSLHEGTQVSHRALGSNPRLGAT
jgi:uncharacterized protein (DUF4415 family)